MKEIPLTQGKVALVDDADFEAVNAFKWCAHKHKHLFHALRKLPRVNGTQKTLYLHTFLLPGVGRIDHRDGDGLNNQRFNIRPATHKENQRAFRRKKPGLSSMFRGVSWHKKHHKWVAQIRVDGKLKHAGYFNAEEDAARAYDIAARGHFGDFASLNFPA